ncbi:MAG: hypothetical protein ACSW75_04775 [Lachnospiraceae bacterium]
MRNPLSGQEVLYFLATLLLATSMVVCFGLLVFLPASRSILLRVVLFLGALLNLLVGVHHVSLGIRRYVVFFVIAAVCAIAVFFF